MDGVAHRVGPSRLPAWVALFVVLVCGVILVSSGWSEWASRDNELRNAEIGLGNLTRSLAQQAEDTIELAAATLTGVAGRLETDGAGPLTIARLQIVLKLRKANLGRLRGIFVYDDVGRWLATTEDVNIADFNNADRDYLNHHRVSANRSILIGRPVQGKSSGQWVITLSQRWNYPDGHFGGVVAATVEVGYFAQFYRQFDVGPHGTISLMHRDGSLLAGSGDGGEGTSQEAVLDQIPFFPAFDSLRVRLPDDNSERIGYYYRDQRYPFVVLTTRTATLVPATPA
jgi:hypothetical protein